MIAAHCVFADGGPSRLALEEIACPLKNPPSDCTQCDYWEAEAEAKEETS